MTGQTETKEPETSLEALQEIDEKIAAAKKRIGAYGAEIAEVEDPALELESAVEETRSRLQEMKLEERRLELGADEKRTRIERLEERLKQVRNVREESAVSAELDMVRSALEGDEQEALTLLDQIRKLELKLDEQEEELQHARAEIEPRRDELMRERESVEASIDTLRERRERVADDLEDRKLRVYEQIRAGGDRKAVSRLTADGACGHCFNVLPLQLQNEIRHGDQMIRCEGCGVILAPPEPAVEDEGDSPE